MLAGYEVDAFRGGELIAELEVFDRAVPVGLAFYGPRTATGLWDSALQEDSDSTPGLLSVTTDALPAAGTYLVLVWADDRDAAARFELRLSCRGNCGEPACPELAPCDLVCDFGFVPDETGCRTCHCQAAPQCGEGVGVCPAGQICGDDSRCRVAPPPSPECTEERPVCDTLGQTWPNACSAENADREVAHLGRCDDSAVECDAARPCPVPLLCESGHCERPRCDCPAETAPVCSEGGATYRNRCELVCHEGAEALAHNGPCGDPAPCRVDGDCFRGQACEPVQEPTNLRLCAESPASPLCQRVCVMAGDMSFCGPGLPECAEAQICYPVDSDRGPCAGRCGLDGGGRACENGLVCADVAVEGLQAGEGVCLPGCDGPLGCPPGFLCLDDAAGTSVCQACNCPRPEAGQEVCTDQQQTFPSACLAECANATNWRAGRCDAEPVCECPLGYAPACAPDGRLYNRCEARCELSPRVPLREPDQCLSPGTPWNTACATDDDCAVGGCEGRLCTAEALGPAVCPPVSDELGCYASEGRCRCRNNRCGFDPTREVERCLEALPNAVRAPEPAAPRNERTPRRE